MNIRPVVEADLPQAAALLAACLPESWSEESLREELTQPCACMLAAEENGLRGMIHLHIIGEDWTVNALAVLSNYRRQGIADKLLSAALIEAAKRGGTHGYLEVRTRNTAAQSLYQKHGFHPVGVRKNFYTHPTEDALIMVYDKERSL